MRQANKLNVRFAAVIGPDELTAHSVRIKNMETGEDQSVSTDKLVDVITQTQST